MHKVLRTQVGHPLRLKDGGQSGPRAGDRQELGQCVWSPQGRPGNWRVFAELGVAITGHHPGRDGETFN